ncbi:MAG: hypothetical protein NVS3B21_13550 [Acidimicrobiales bacterium]
MTLSGHPPGDRGGSRGTDAPVAKRWSAEELLRAVVASSPLALYVVDPAGCVQLWNPAAERLFGWSAADAIGTRLPFVGPNSQDEYDRLRNRVLAGRGFTGIEARRQHRAGHMLDVSISTVPLHDDDGVIRAVLGVSQDITARKAAEADLVRQTRYDPLTGLHSRAFFLDLVDAELAKAHRRHVLIYLDLDDFKSINDVYGHHVGDEVLTVIADRLREVVRAGDIVARMGGDEFGVFLRGVGVKKVHEVAARIFGAFAAPLVVEGLEFAVHASGGITLCQGSKDGDDAMRAADVAMYAAKKRLDVEFLVFDDKMGAAVRARAALEVDLWRAIEADELSVHYQPIASTATGRLVGMEALVRWNHPTHGFISPERFIPIAEESGSIIALGRFVLSQACGQLRAWIDRYPAAANLRMSVNLSIRQLKDPGLRAYVAEMLATHDLAPYRLQLEVTESVLAESGADDTLAGLRTLGITLAIDDFGTGHSSLTSVRRFPVSTLKIDQSFVAGIEHSAEDTAIVAATIGLGRSLGLSTVAEGVETRRQLEILCDLGCDELQGYFIFRPQPSSSLTDMLAADLPLTDVPIGLQKDLGAGGANPTGTSRPALAAKRSRPARRHDSCSR